MQRCQSAQKLTLISHSTFIENEIYAHIQLFTFLSLFVRSFGRWFFGKIISLSLWHYSQMVLWQMFFYFALAVVVAKSRLTTLWTCRLLELSWSFSLFLPFGFKPKLPHSTCTLNAMHSIWSMAWEFAIFTRFSKGKTRPNACVSFLLRCFRCCCGGYSDNACGQLNWHRHAHVRKTEKIQQQKRCQNRESSEFNAHRVTKPNSNYRARAGKNHHQRWFSQMNNNPQAMCVCVCVCCQAVPIFVFLLIRH